MTICLRSLMYIDHSDYEQLSSYYFPHNRIVPICNTRPSF